MNKNFFIWFLELVVPLAIPVVIISLPLGFILELFPSLSKYEDIFIYAGLIIIFIIFSIIRKYLQRKKVILKIIDKLSKNKK